MQDPHPSPQTCSQARHQTKTSEINETETTHTEKQPSPSRLKQIGLAIRKAVMTVLAYCAGLGDEALKGAAKEVGASVGKWLGPGLVGYMISQSQAFNNLAEALIRLADKF